MRARHAGEQLDDGDGHGGEDAVEDVEQQHAGRGEDGQQELAAAERPQAPELGDVDEPDGRVDDQAAERGGREGGDHRAEGEHRDDRPGPRPRASTAACARHSPRRSTVRLALELTGKPPTSDEPDVGGAHGQELLVVVHARARAGREGARGEDVVGVADDEDAQGGQQQEPRSLASSDGRPTFMPSKETSPTVVTPCAVRSKTATTAVARSMTMRGTGTRGKRGVKTRSSTATVRPMASGRPGHAVPRRCCR